MCADCDPLNGGGGSYYPPNDPNFSTARQRPVNQTLAPIDGGLDPHPRPGVNLGSRNFNWGVPLVHLTGRAGLDLDLTLSLNSLVWTKDGSNIKYNADLGSPAPGFQLGFPKLQQRFTDSLSGGYAYEMVTPAGSRVELRQIGTSSIYESQDGSYTQLDTSTMVVRTTDGTQFTFVPVTNNSEYRCTQIKDRNGNYISATYDTTNGHLLTITDTLGRLITFAYDGSNNLSTIQQMWAGVIHNWATFSYGQVWPVPNFGGGLHVNGPNNSTWVTVLTQVSLHDGSYYTFNYNTNFGQVNRINYYAPDAHLLAYTSYNLDSSTGQTDCPRFTEQHVWAQNWNNNAEAVTTYSVASDNSWSQETAPDGTIYKEFFATSGWQNGLTTSTENWSGGVKQKWTTLTWTQDNTSLSYQNNPRVTETNIYDASGNRRRTTISYSSVTVGSTVIHLPETVREYGGANADQVLRRTDTLYMWNSVMLDKRVIGVLWRHVVYEGESTLRSMEEYVYDWLNNVQNTAPSVHHDTANYGAGLGAARGIVVGVLRYNANDTSQGIWVRSFGYNLAGEIVWTDDARGHRTNISYTDSFSDGNNGRGTLAYPTTITDADNYSSTVQYNFDFGGVTRTQDPKGAVVTTTYDSAARTQQVTNQFNGAYRRFVYTSDGLQVLSYETIQDGAGEAYSNTVLDGAGRVRASAADNPGSTGLYVGQYTTYDVMGRAVASTNPTEINGSWTPAGDDAAGWIWTNQSYDWKGRPMLTTLPDGSTRENTYGGCGCAGGEVITVRDERGRRKRYTKDVLGRLVTVEELNWDQTVYATTTYSYNALDQITQINQAGQTRSFDYDGHARLWHRITPEQGTTTYIYFDDDTVQTVTDARGATTTFAYNNRDLSTSITYGVPAGVGATANVSFGYDAAGNRTSMADGLGSVSYGYNTLSRMTSESRTFTGLGTYTLTYAYNLAGELTSITNPWSAQVSYNHDKIGRPTSVSGSGYYGVSSYVNSISYRAFGGAKQVAYGNGRTLSLGYDNRRRVTDWTVPSVLGWQYSYTDVGENSGRVMFAKNTVSSTAGGARDDTLDRSYDYDHLGRLIVSHTGYEARLHMNRQQQGDSTNYGPYSQSYGYDQWGNMTTRVGWGGTDGGYINWTPSYTNNRLNTNPATGAAMQYDAAGNLTNDSYQVFSYDATGQQAYASGSPVSQSYDGDGLRVKKLDAGITTWYLRSSVLSGQVICELNVSGSWARGYVYLGGQMVAIQSSGVNWVHQDPITKSQRVTNSSGTVTSTIDLDPWGGETSTSSNQAFQPHRYTSYERDVNGSDDAMMRRYHAYWNHFDQPDPHDGSYDFADRKVQSICRRRTWLRTVWPSVSRL
jgi:YD repeat-containing protein